MALSGDEIRRDLATFAARWSVYEGSERAEAQSFLNGLFLCYGQERAAVLMHKYQEMEYAQIAGTLECSESAVKSLLFRAYETLRSRLAHLAG